MRKHTNKDGHLLWLNFPFTDIPYLRTFSSASPGATAVNFMTMTYGVHQVRRLSTASSVLRPPNFILTTQWIWYWKDETGIWNEYRQVRQTCKNNTMRRDQSIQEFVIIC